MLVSVKSDEIEFGELCTIGFERTLRVPADGRDYAVPPGLGTFPIHDLTTHAGVPASWKRHGTLAIALAPCEALWVCFSARWWHPCAVRLGVNGVNALTGRRFTGILGKSQDYLACPAQPWLAAHSPRPGDVRQFLAPPLHSDTRNRLSQVLDLRILVHPPRPGLFQENPPKSVRNPFVLGRRCELRLGPGEDMTRRVCPDPHGPEAWDPSPAAEVHLQLMSASTFRGVTGADPAPSPIDRRDYATFGVPWFAEYEELAAG